MGRPKEGIVKLRQNPLRDRYRGSPGDAWITDGAQTRNACGEDPFHGAVVPTNASSVPWRFGIHRAVGGYHDHPNPGDILCAALAACLDSTLRMLADHLDIGLESLEVTVNAECDVRGCLLVERTVPVGFQRMQCHVRLEPRGDVDPKQIQGLLAAAEHSCVVLQTLRNGVAVQTQAEIPEREMTTASATVGSRGS